MKKLEIGVIGLGKFGFQLSQSLTVLGHSVVGVDSNEHRVQQISDHITQVFAGDATDKRLLDQLRFQDLDQVVIAVGDSMESSILIAMNLQELHAKHIIAKANSEEHKKVLLRLGVNKVILPEIDVAIQTAHFINNPGMLDLLPVGGGVLIQEVEINHWQGKSLANLNLTRKHKVIAVAKGGAGRTTWEFVPDALTPLQKGESLILVGHPDDIYSLNP